MSSVWRRILDDVATQLATVSGVTFIDNPTRSIIDEDVPVVALFDGDEQEVGRFTGARQFTARFEVGIVAKDAGGGAARRAALDTVYVAVQSALEADLTRGGAANDTRFTGRSDPLPVTDEGRRQLITQDLFYEVDYWTAENDIESEDPAT